MALNTGNLFIDAEDVLEDENGTHTIITNGGCSISFTEKKFGNSSIYFDGVNDYLTLGNHDDFDLRSLATDWTIDFWLNIDAANITKTFFSIGTLDYQALSIIVVSSKVWWLCSTTGTTWSNIITAPTNFVPDTWFHIAAVKQGNTVTLYINGTSVGTSVLSADIRLGADFSAKIGSHYQGGQYPLGYIDNFRLVKGQALWTTNFSTATEESLFYKDAVANPDRPSSMRRLFNINKNLRGIAKQGYCRPTVAEMWDASEDYSYPWCTAEPVWDNLDNVVLENNDEVVTTPI